MSAQAHAETHEHHILPLRIYFGVATALLVLTAITVAVAQVDFGAMNMVVAMTVAAIKATLVCLFFMHLLYDNKFFSLVFISSLLFLSIFITLTMYDVVRRDGVYEQKQNTIIPEAVIYQTKSSMNMSSASDHSSDTVETQDETGEASTHSAGE